MVQDGFKNYNFHRRHFDLSQKSTVMLTVMLVLFKLLFYLFLAVVFFTYLHFFVYSSTKRGVIRSLSSLLLDVAVDLPAPLGMMRHGANVV